MFDFLRSPPEGPAVMTGPYADLVEGGVNREGHVSERAAEIKAAGGERT
jgi:hypothetical protein